MSTRPFERNLKAFGAGKHQSSTKSTGVCFIVSVSLVLIGLFAHASMMKPVSPLNDSSSFSANEHISSFRTAFVPDFTMERRDHRRPFFSLLASWKSLKAQRMVQNRTILQRTISYAVVPSNNKGVIHDDVTLLTHLSVNKLETLLRQVARWQGPVSAAVYISSDQQLEEFTRFVSHHHDNALQQTTFHIFMETPAHPKGYPHNILRNLALDYMETDYFLALDSDFVTTTDCHNRLVSYLAKDPFKSLLQSKTVVVLPAFEMRRNAPNISMVPNSKEEVIQQVKLNVTAPFQIDQYAPGHLATNYTKWLDSVSGNGANDITYPIEYAAQYEPYIMGYRHGIPKYWKAFRGYYFNKASWLAEIHFAGFRYAVFHQEFVVHVGRSSSKPPSEIIFATNFGVWNDFKKYLQMMYGAPEEESWWGAPIGVK